MTDQPTDRGEGLVRDAFYEGFNAGIEFAHPLNTLAPDESAAWEDSEAKAEWDRRCAEREAERPTLSDKELTKAAEKLKADLWAQADGSGRVWKPVEGVKLVEALIRRCAEREAEKAELEGDAECGHPKRFTVETFDRSVPDAEPSEWCVYCEWERDHARRYELEVEVQALHSAHDAAIASEREQWAQQSARAEAAEAELERLRKAARAVADAYQTLEVRGSVAEELAAATAGMELLAALGGEPQPQEASEGQEAKSND